MMFHPGDIVLLKSSHNYFDGLRIVYSYEDPCIYFIFMCPIYENSNYPAYNYNLVTNIFRGDEDFIKDLLKYE